MRTVGSLVMGTLSLLLLAVPAGARDRAGPKYEIDTDNKVVRGPFVEQGKLCYKVTFQVKVTGQDAPGEESRDVVVFRENGKEAYRLALRQAKAKDLTAVLAMDISGSMARNSKSGQSKMKEAQGAARLFLTRLHARANPGLILFDHKVQLAIPPVRDLSQLAGHRARLLQEIDKAKPQGGTAYLDAAYDALRMLEKIAGNRAVVLMTDGIDLNSRHTAREVVTLANQLRIPVYVLGVGDPGWSEPVSTVLVLDHSKSMEAPTGADKKTKIAALHEAASRFVALMRPGAKVTLLPFSSRVETPEDFTSNQTRLKQRIYQLLPEGGTSLYDATLAGIETVVAARNPGKKYVVALTDGVDEDPGSRCDPEEVIRRAKEAEVPLYMLGLGARNEINEKVMRQMAEQTGGKFFHAENQQKLYEVFETLSIDIHGDGIDEAALKKLANDTKGKYYRAADASELKLIYGELADKLQSQYETTFPSLNQRQDGTVSKIDMYVVDKEGKIVSNTVEADKSRFGLVVPEVDYLVYLGLLGILVGLLVLPAWLKQRSGAAARPPMGVLIGSPASGAARRR